MPDELSEVKSSPPWLKPTLPSTKIWPKSKFLFIIVPEAPDVPPETVCPTLNFVPNPESLVVSTVLGKTLRI